MVKHKGGYLIKQLREIKGESQSDLAKRVGIAQSTLSEIESSIKQPSAKLLKKLADAMNFEMDEFYEGRNL